MTQSQKKFFNSNDAKNLINIYGFALFPIHGIVDGKCTCGHDPCANAGKHPATPNGLKDATKDMAELSRLWNSRKGLNVGIATGEISGIFVIDIDGEEGEQDIRKLGELPQTLTAVTGRGRHLFFKHSGGLVKTRKGIIGNKIDVRGDGGYVAGAGSIHSNGNVYAWSNPLDDIATAPKWLLDIVTKENIQKEVIPAPLFNPPKLFVSNQWQESDVVDMLRYISPDIGYDEWIKVGMAIQAEGFGFQIWDDWSRGSSSKYQAATMQSHWRSFRPGNGVSFGTLVKMAQDGGWGKKSNYSEFPNSSILGVTPDNQSAPKKILENQIDTDKTRLVHPRIEYVLSNHIDMSIDSSDFVQGLLANNQLSVIYGESNCGKTFFMTDLCFHIATGRPWRDRRVVQGGIIYAALEGSYGLRNRVAAYRMKHGLDNAKFAMVTSQVDFLSKEGNIDQFIDCIKRSVDDLGEVKMVVVDTLARALAGGDENSGQDMGALVYHADRIRHETGAHVSFVHHSGKNRLLGARGHSSLRAAVDTEIEIFRDDGADYSSIKVVKQREMEQLDDMFFSLERVVLGINKYEEEITSCVVKVMDEDDLIKPKEDKKLPHMQGFVYDAIVNALAIRGEKRTPHEGVKNVATITYEQLGEELENRGFKEILEQGKNAKKVTNNQRSALRKAGKIDYNKGYIWLT